MASASFRDSMGSLGWSRREADVPVNTSSPSVLSRLQNLNPFGTGGYVSLPITETNPGAPLPAPTRREEEEAWFARKSTISTTVANSPLPPSSTPSSSLPLSILVCSRGGCQKGRFALRTPSAPSGCLVMSSRDKAASLVSPAQPKSRCFSTLQTSSMANRQLASSRVSTRGPPPPETGHCHLALHGFHGLRHGSRRD
ncbi:hypothetical protein IAQ61_006304 [Plenodomus lingam]|uniref:uncharacterized protein n=1 Tax=Leptosphaeria maculans TaxID=5022 RepID=UPI003326ABFF|nr:hypothetical protein IAQ61_006304 [Plenodomus lingam]